MKHISTFIIAMLACVSIASADDRPIDFKQLPKAAQEFVTTYFPNMKVSFSSMDDDFIRPDYSVVFSDGTKIEFDNSGSLDKIEMRTGAVPDAVIPVQIANYVKTHYPDARITEYEVGKKDYEVRLSNSLELKFNSRFNLVETDC